MLCTTASNKISIKQTSTSGLVEETKTLDKNRKNDHPHFLAIRGHV